MKTRVIALALAIGASSLPAAFAGSCGPAQVCSETTSSFAGTVISDGVTTGTPTTTVGLVWETASEAGIRGYRVGRYDCGEASNCMTWTHLVMATSSCGEQRSYEVVDAAPGPAGSWRYRLEVWGRDGLLGCVVDVTAE